ncbi:MAG TPA: hypothetical protein VMV05_12235 [bacterium]|nr:hypothetical protein [bacterium]
MTAFKPISSPLYRVSLSPAACSVDLGDGSERGEYVHQDYILSTLGRPHRAINLMYCYYPYDRGWPKRASVAHKPKGKGTWPYPYDDYFPFPGGLKGDTEGDAFQQMRDIRRHGQEVTLTLTVDCDVTDDHIRVIARQLKPYGRLRLRLNHECDGFWFTFNRRYSYEVVGQFFVRFSKIFKKEAPLIQMMSCWGHVVDYKTGELKFEKELTPILPAADVWSADHYLTLDFGWPFHDCEPEKRDKSYKITGVDEVWRQLKGVHRRFVQLCGVDKGLEIGEFNADGNVGGEVEQARMTESFYRRVLKKKPRFITGITYYQFRDRARLGLEREDPNHFGNGLPTPFLPIYKELIQEPYFQPKETWNRSKGPLRMEWRSADDSDGLGWTLSLKAKPIFLELLFDSKANLMIHAGKKWFYKKVGVEKVDVTQSAAEWGKSKPFPVAVFAPPADGMNPNGAPQATARLAQSPRARLYYKWISKPAR